MKRIILILLALPLFMMSCRKEAINIQERDSSSSPTFQMKLSVDAQSVSGPQLRNIVSQFTLILYDPQDGEEIFRQSQDVSSPTFGTLNLQIPHGTYRAVAIASYSPFGINELFPTGTPVRSPYNTAFMEYHQGSAAPEERRYKTGDTFFASGVYTVDNSGNVDLVLQRIVGKLEVEVRDAEEFQLRVKNEATGFAFESGKAVGIISEPSYQVANGSKNEPLSFYIIQTGQPLELEITAGGKTIAMNAPVYKNQVTVVSGNIEAAGSLSKLSSRNGNASPAFRTIIKPL